ncbi:YtxH domain-containing protein [Paraflavisolibacter sp. H34]|uniref:YtxH domain-containing protein n=1 Tax=Huijunlia imazamoxiresistens TaxID=3127457 RepID=UPI00301897AB
MTTKSKVILGLVGAAAAGVVVGLILAPEKGSDLRQKITSTAGDWADQLSDLLSSAKSEIDNLKAKGAKVASDAAGKYNESFS